jgi:hypothetical protein
VDMEKITAAQSSAGHQASSHPGSNILVRRGCISGR